MISRWNKKERRRGGEGRRRRGRGAGAGGGRGGRVGEVIKMRNEAKEGERERSNVTE